MKLYGEDDKKVKKYITKESIENVLLIAGANLTIISLFTMILSLCNFLTMSMSIFMEHLAVMCLATGFVFFTFYIVIHFVIKN